MWQRLKHTLSEPRIISGATVAAYMVVLALGIDLIPNLRGEPAWQWVPAIMMMTGAAVGLPCAWLGGPKRARWELVFMPISLGGLLGGIVIESSTLWGNDFAGHVLIALGMIVLIVVIVRWVWLTRYYDLF
ncbi:hypothetical protein U6G28_02680 [Actinomycetaceae bacterium MB13-C1-2]|nr:hypothetical protein U6G28_02680 [Actinomycetaceae bacterium MB13-C1-2]